MDTTPAIRILSEPEGGTVPDPVRKFLAACDAMPDYTVDKIVEVCKVAGVRENTLARYYDREDVKARRYDRGPGVPAYAGNVLSVAYCRKPVHGPNKDREWRAR